MHIFVVSPQPCLVNVKEIVCWQWKVKGHHRWPPLPTLRMLEFKSLLSLTVPQRPLPLPDYSAHAFLWLSLPHPLLLAVPLFVVCICEHFAYLLNNYFLCSFLSLHFSPHLLYLHPNCIFLLTSTCLPFPKDITLNSCMSRSSTTLWMDSSCLMGASRWRETWTLQGLWYD